MGALFYTQLTIADHGGSKGVHNIYDCIKSAVKIDLIVTKSVSRFARHTADSLTTIRKLKEKGVVCFFEKENIWTFDGKDELLITIMSSLAREESRSILENCTWGQRKRMADGRVSILIDHFLDYDRGPHVELVINEEQAKTVWLINRHGLSSQPQILSQPFSFPYPSLALPHAILIEMTTSNSINRRMAFPSIDKTQIPSFPVNINCNNQLVISRA